MEFTIRCGNPECGDLQLYDMNNVKQFHCKSCQKLLPHRVWEKIVREGQLAVLWIQLFIADRLQSEADPRQKAFDSWKVVEQLPRHMLEFVFSRSERWGDPAPSAQREELGVALATKLGVPFDLRRVGSRCWGLKDLR